MNRSVFVLLTILPVALDAQVARQPDFEVAAAQWTLDLGTASNAATRIGVYSAGIGWRVSDFQSLLTRVSYAPEGRIDPGLIALEGGMRVETRRGPRMGLFGTLTAGLIRWRADNNERIREGCGPPLCLFEGVGYTSGSEYTMALRIGARIPVARTFTFEPHLEGSIALGGTGGRGGEETKIGRLGVAIARRP